MLQTLFLDRKANLARALALERSMRSTKKGRASLRERGGERERERERERTQAEVMGCNMHAHSRKQIHQARRAEWIHQVRRAEWIQSPDD